MLELFKKTQKKHEECRNCGNCMHSILSYNLDSGIIIMECSKSEFEVTANHKCNAHDYKENI